MCSVQRAVCIFPGITPRLRAARWVSTLTASGLLTLIPPELPTYSNPALRKFKFWLQVPRGPADLLVCVVGMDSGCMALWGSSRLGAAAGSCCFPGQLWSESSKNPFGLFQFTWVAPKLHRAVVVTLLLASRGQDGLEACSEAASQCWGRPKSRNRGNRSRGTEAESLLSHLKSHS